MNCPICDRASVERYKPFCSRRCADVDLANWLSGNYRISTPDEDQPVEEDLEGPSRLH